jgi:hypothetical protein
VLYHDDRVREIAAVTISSGNADCGRSAFQRMAAVMRVRPHHHGVPLQREVTYNDEAVIPDTFSRVQQWS